MGKGGREEGKEQGPSFFLSLLSWLLHPDETHMKEGDERKERSGQWPGATKEKEEEGSLQRGVEAPHFPHTECGKGEERGGGEWRRKGEQP